MTEIFTNLSPLGFGPGHNSKRLDQRHIEVSCNGHIAIVNFYKQIVDEEGCWSNKYPNMKGNRKMMHSNLVKLGILEERQITNKGGRTVKQWRLLRPYRGDYKKLIEEEVKRSYINSK